MLNENLISRKPKRNRNMLPNCIRLFDKKRLCAVSRCVRKFSNLATNKEHLIVDNGTTEEHYPLIWLRDNCQCENCYNKNLQSRIVNWHSFSIDINTKYVKNNETNIEILWTDDHKSVFHKDWLRDRSFTRDYQEKYLKENYKFPRVFWSSKDFNSILNIYDYPDVMNSNKIFYNWLKDLATKGVVLIENVPLDKDECKKLINKVAFSKPTHYGQEHHITSKPNPSNLAYVSGVQLQFHTDLPYYQYLPGQTKSSGGQSVLSDAFYVAEKLRRENQTAFDILSGTEVNWLDIGEEDGKKFHKIHRCPVISLDARGSIEAIRYSTPQRDSFFTVDVDTVTKWYKALRIYINMVIAEKVQIKFKPGQLLAFDNTRLLHGRVKYEDNNEGQRHLVGNYLDWDEIWSRIRVLKSELNI